MQYLFYKYHGAGNDFILLDDRDEQWPTDHNELARRLCQRRYGIGADGLVVLTNATEGDFGVNYYNADGTTALCGNGLRCAVHLAHTLGIIGHETTFSATDGLHRAHIAPEGIACSMAPVAQLVPYANGLCIDTGTPHYVEEVANVANFDVITAGRKVRYATQFQPNGINATFVTNKGTGELVARTYERGVEGETQACGTGAVAAALFVAQQASQAAPITVHMPGGKLQVRFTHHPHGGFENIYLQGPAVQVFAGTLHLAGSLAAPKNV